MHPDQDIWETRDRLPIERSWDHIHDGRTDRIRVTVGAIWPEIHVRIRPHGSDVEVRGTFSSTGRLRELEFVALADHAEVSTADLRWSGAIRALKEWEAVGREIGSQILAGRKPDETAFDARTPTEALRTLSYSAQRRPAAVRRGPAFEQLLRDVAEDYRQAVQEGDPKPRVTLAAKYGYSVAHVGWLLTQARKPRNGRPPLLGAAHPGRAGEEPGQAGKEPAKSPASTPPIAGRGTVQPSPFGPVGKAGEEPKFDPDSGEQVKRDEQPIVAAIVTSGRGVLVGRRNDGKPPWTFIAGEQEPGELPEDTAIREVKEEAALRVQAGELIGERVHPKTGRNMIYMAARPTHGTEVFVGDEEELAEVRWVGLAEADELLPGMFEPVREHLERELGGTA